MTERVLKESLELLDEAEKLGPTWAWDLVDPATSGQPGATGYVAKASEWVAVVFRFSIEDQGFPKGSYGYDGAVRKGTTIVHCTRRTAENLWRIADARRKS